MHTVHSVSDSSGSYLLSFKPSRSIGNTTLFHDDEYTRLLNHLLALELGTVDLYRRCHVKFYQVDITRLEQAHQTAAKNLVNLIVANRGIPKKAGLALPTEISIFATRVTNRLGERVAFQTSRKICLGLERYLRRKYHSALEVAPCRDYAVLNHLIHTTKSHILLLEQSEWNEDESH
jgi:hypothetical protein